jgi:hypothetical protein
MLPQAYAIPAAATAVESIGPVLAPFAILAALVVLGAFLFLAWGAILHAPTAGLFVGSDAWDVDGSDPALRAGTPYGDGDDDVDGLASPRLVA